MFEAIFRSVLIGVLGMAFHMSGCANTEVPGMAVVTGTVVLDGQPVEDGTILFEPKDGEGQAVSAVIKKDGRFEARVPQGEKCVRINWPKVTGQKKVSDTPDSLVIDTVEEMVPEKYNSKSALMISVGMGKSKLDFRLETPRK